MKNAVFSLRFAGRQKRVNSLLDVLKCDSNNLQNKALIHRWGKCQINCGFASE